MWLPADADRLGAKPKYKDVMQGCNASGESRVAMQWKLARIVVVTPGDDA